MKKVILVCALMVSSISMAVPDLEAQIASSKAIQIGTVLGTGIFAMLTEQISQEWLSYTTVKGAQLAMTLMSLGFVFGRPAYRDAAVRVPVMLLMAQLADVPQMHQVAYKLPFGIGDALKATGEKATSAILLISGYKYVADPLLAMFLYHTKLGQMTVGVPVASNPAN